jgi:hypothetical protein
MTLIELLLAATLMIVVLFATLSVMEVFQTNNTRTTELINSIDGGRNAMGRLTRDIRAATASSLTATPDASVLTRAQPQDLVLKRIDPFGTPSAANVNAVQTVRWCLDAPARVLHRQVAAGIVTPSVTCPAVIAGFTDTAVAMNIANGTRAVFSFDSVSLPDVSSVNTFLAIDRDPARRPAEATLTSGVFLRNQNRAPLASFTSVTLAGRNVQLNAQGSRDPEGGILTYEWRDGTTLLPYVNAVASYVAASSGARSITLTVRDRDGLAGSQTQNVTVLP